VILPRFLPLLLLGGALAAHPNSVRLLKVAEFSRMLRLDVNECSATLSSKRHTPVVHVNIGVKIDCVSFLESLACVARGRFKHGNMPREPEPEVEARSGARDGRARDGRATWSIGPGTHAILLSEEEEGRSTADLTIPLQFELKTLLGLCAHLTSTSTPSPVSSASEHPAVRRSGVTQPPLRPPPVPSQPPLRPTAVASTTAVVSTKNKLMNRRLSDNERTATSSTPPRVDTSVKANTSSTTDSQPKDVTWVVVLGERMVVEASLSTAGVYDAVRQKLLNASSAYFHKSISIRIHREGKLTDILPGRSDLYATNHNRLSGCWNVSAKFGKEWSDRSLSVIPKR
jgi:hypothetical protein